MWNYVHQHTLMSQVLLFRGASVFCIILNTSLCFSSLPCYGDRDDAELLGHIFHWRSGWSSSSWPSLAAALCVQGPGGYQIPCEACRESRLQRDLRDSGHAIPRQAHWWCAQQVPASSSPQVDARWWDVGWACGSATVTVRCCGRNLSLAQGISSRCRMLHWLVTPENWAHVACCAWAMICFGSKLSFLGCLQTVKDAACWATWGCRLRKLERWGISLYLCQCILGCIQNSAGHSPVQPALTLKLDPAAELAVLWMGAWTKWTKGPFWPALRSLLTCVILWYCTGSGATLLPTTEPLSKQLQLFFYSNTEAHGYQSFEILHESQFLSPCVFWDIF